MTDELQQVLAYTGAYPGGYDNPANFRYREVAKPKRPVFDCFSKRKVGGVTVDEEGFSFWERISYGGNNSQMVASRAKREERVSRFENFMQQNREARKIAAETKKAADDADLREEARKAGLPKDEFVSLVQFTNSMKDGSVIRICSGISEVNTLRAKLDRMAEQASGEEVVAPFFTSDVSDAEDELPVQCFESPFSGAVYHRTSSKPRYSNAFLDNVNLEITDLRKCQSVLNDTLDELRRRIERIGSDNERRSIVFEEEAVEPEVVQPPPADEEPVPTSDRPAKSRPEKVVDAPRPTAPTTIDITPEPVTEDKPLVEVVTTKETKPLEKTSSQLDTSEESIGPDWSPK